MKAKHYKLNTYNMKTKNNKAALVKSSNKATKVNKVNKVVIPKVSNSILQKLDSIEKYDNLKDDKKNSFRRLLQVSRLNIVENMGLNKGLKQFLRIAKEELTYKQIKVLTFSNVIEHIKVSKYKNLPLFSSHQIVLICNEVLKAKDKATLLAFRLDKQDKVIAKK